MARIVRPWGLKGAVIADLSTEDPGRLTGAVGLTVGEPGRETTPVRVSEARAHGRGRAVLFLEGCGSIEAAEEFRGRVIYIDRSGVGPPPEGRHYAFEVLGCRVRTVSGEELGVVGEIRVTGGADLLVVERAGRELLIPFVKEICPRVDPAERLIEVDPPEGLLELDEI